MNNQPNNSIVPILLAIIVLLIGGGVYIYSNNKVVPANTESITTAETADVPAAQTNNIPSSNSVTVTPITSSANIKVTSPNGGEIWKEGQTQVVQWSAQNITGNQSVKLVDLNNRVVMTITSDIAANNTSTGLYQISWVLPAEFVSEASPIKYKILVSANDGSALDYSDLPLTIVADGKGI